MDEIFDISKFNIIQDDDNYYFFRTINKDELSENENSVSGAQTTSKLETGLIKHGKVSKYTLEDQISLEEVHDHVKWGHRKDTNCISLSTNSNISLTYGYNDNDKQYVMITVPKSKFKDSNFCISGKFLIEEIDKRIKKMMDDHYVDTKTINFLRLIDSATSNDELFSILESYASLEQYKVNKTKFYDYLTLDAAQNLEKNKIIAKLDIINRRILPQCNNSLLIESIKFAFTSSEIIHYKEIKEDINLLSPITMELFSLLQQAKTMGLEADKIDFIILMVIKYATNKLQLNNQYGDYNTFVKKYNNEEQKIKVSDVYNLTAGRIPFFKAYKSLLFSKSVANSKLKTNDLCKLLKEIVDDKEYDTLIDKINEKCYAIIPDFVSRNMQTGLRLSDSVCLDMNVDGKKLFSEHEQKRILDYINSLNDEQKKQFISANSLDGEQILCNLLNTTYNDDIDLNKYYAETIIEYLDLDAIYSASYLQKKLTNDEKMLLLSYLEKANCINMFDSLVELDIDNSKIANIIFNLLLNNGYQGLNFIDLSNNQEFKDIIYSNLNNISSKVSAIKLDYLLGIRDNDNFVPSTNITLRDYQKLAVDRVDEIFGFKNFAGVVLPTGAGKSFIAITEMLRYRDKNILYYAPNREILRQLQKHILKHVLNLSVIPEEYVSYYIEHPDKIPEGFIFQSDVNDIISAAFPQLNMYCYQGLTANDDEFLRSKNAGLIVLDEVHRTGAAEWKEKIKILIKNNPNAKILGITATPVRDVDNQNMVEKLAELSGSYTSDEITKKKYMAAEMYLVDAMQEEIVVTPNIITFDYSLEDSEYYNEIKRMYESEDNPYKKEELRKIYDEMRKIIEVSQKKGISEIIKEGFENNNKPKNGRYIVFLPINRESKISTEEYMLSEIEKVKEYFKDIDAEPEIDYLLSNRKVKTENSNAINRFEKESKHLKLIFAINMLNEGVHVDGIDGIVMLRPLDSGTKILYYQQIGRCIHALDPKHELKTTEIPIIFDVYNNYLEQNMDRQINRHTVTSDLQKLYLIKAWINKHFRYPDINSESIDEARKAMTLKRIQQKYLQYLNNPIYSNNLTDADIYEIEEIVNIGKSIELWDIVIPERVSEKSEVKIEQFSSFKLKGEQKKFIELFKQASMVNGTITQKSKQLRLIEILNILDVLSEYNFDINNTTVPLGCILQTAYSHIPENVLELVKKEITTDIGYELGKEYNEAKKQFYKKNPIFLDYDIKTLRKMGIFELCNIYEGFKNINIIDKNGFIIHGLDKFLNLNIYTGTYFSPEGLNINGLDEQNFSPEDAFFNKYGFGRDGYYYELTSDGQRIKTDSLYNPDGFDVKGDYYQLQPDGTYKKVGKLNPYNFDINGIFYKYNKITKEYVTTNSHFDDRGFDKNGIFCTTAESIGNKTKVLEFCDGVERVFSDVTYVDGIKKINRSSRFITNLPYDLNYFDRDGYYYTLDAVGNRVKSNVKYNDRFLDAEGYYYELQPDGTRIKTERKYDDNYYDLNGYYYELQPDGTRTQTKELYDKTGANYLGLIIKYTPDNCVQRKKKYVAFDRDGYCYSYTNGRFVKMEPATKISKYGFDVNGYYHELLPNGTRDETPTDKKVDEHGFDEYGIYFKPKKLGTAYFITTILNEYNFSQDGYYWKKQSYPTKTKSKKDPHGFDIDGLYDFKLHDGKTVKRPYNNRYLSIDGYYYRKITNQDGTVERKKTGRKVDIRGFDLDGTHYDLSIDENAKKIIYSNPQKYDENGFDVDGIFYEKQKVTYKNGGGRVFNGNRIKTTPPRNYNEHNFNFRGFYCEVNGKKVVVTNSKYNLYGFDMHGYYKELDENGEKTIFDPNGFTIDGNYSVINNEGVRVVTNAKVDSRGFCQKDYLDYESGKIKTDKHGFDVKGKYIDEEGNICGRTNKYGFDADGYYHKLLPDGTRDETSKGEITNLRGFDIDGFYHKLTPTGTRASWSERLIKVDERGFDIDGYFPLDDIKIPCDRRQFDIDGYYYHKINDEYVKTDRKVDDKGFDVDGYYYKKIDGEYINTNQKYNDQGLDYHGFNKKGIHHITGLPYNENYFNQAGINIVTGDKYSLTGYTIDEIFVENCVSKYAKERNYTYDVLECVYIAKKALSLPLDKRHFAFEEIKSDSRDKRILNDLLYKNIVAASVLDSEVKNMLIEYIAKLSDEINRLKKLIKEEKEKAIKDEELLKKYTKKLSSYKEMKKNTEIGDIHGRDIYKNS